MVIVRYSTVSGATTFSRLAHINFHCHIAEQIIQRPPTFLLHLSSSFVLPDKLSATAKGSYFYVLCRNVCDQDQNWIKRSNFWVEDQGIKVTSKLLKIKGSRTCCCNLTFDPWKSSDQEPQKGTIRRLSTFFAHQKTWQQSQMLQQVAYKWLLLVLICGYESCTQVLSQRKLTIQTLPLYKCLLPSLV